MCLIGTAPSTHQQDSESVIELKPPAQHADTLVGEPVVVEIEVHQSVVEFQGLSHGQGTLIPKTVPR